jgi:hypothetical protein
MKKILLTSTLIFSILLMGSFVLAEKPDANLAGAQKIDWNLSGAVMPVPPYGSGDIAGSDEASKLIVNQPNGKIEAAITGAMKGLAPNTTYTVYLSNGYTPYTPTSITTNTWVWTVLGTYRHDVTITQQNPDGTFSGTAGYPSEGEPWDSAGETTEVITGKIVGSTFYMTTKYNGPYNPGYSVAAVGTIQTDGSIVGTSPWAWSAPAGTVKLASGSTGWPGLFTATVQPFIFTTDEEGAGSWHINLKDENFAGAGEYALSVWINGGGGTVLISDSFDVVVD